MDKFYKQNGYKKIHFNKKKNLSILKKKILNIFKKISIKKKSKIKINNHKDIINLYKKNKKIWVMAYDQIRNMPELYGLIFTSDFLKKISKVSGIKIPILTTSKITIRLDMPNGQGSTLTKPHQDYVAHQGSSNSITIWIPLQDTLYKNGSLNIIKGSHKKGFVSDNLNWKTNKISSNLISKKKANTIGKFENIETKFGEVLLFSTFLVHKSGLNLSTNIRYSINIRFNDINSQDYADRNYYLNEISGSKKLNLNFIPKNVFEN